MQEKYDSAQIYMHKYEEQGGLFSNDGIEHEREHYYFIKGLYNIGIENIDSAEYYFRKVIKYGYLYDGYRGLALVYKKTDEKDSLVKYTELAQQSLEEATENSQSNDVVKVNSEYNHKTKHNDILYVIALCMLFIIMATFFIFVFVQKKVRRKFDSDTVLIVSHGAVTRCLHHIIKNSNLDNNLIDFKIYLPNFIVPYMKSTIHTIRKIIEHTRNPSANIALPLKLNF